MDRMNKFKMIMIAMWNFESANKHLPPAAICDKNGKPLLSWRVAILPYLDENKLYKQFHLDEPWDSPHNLPLAAKMPDIYANTDRQLCEVSATQARRPFRCQSVRKRYFMTTWAVRLAT